jgi:MFS superfamily sulfate permease-like transporter
LFFANALRFRNEVRSLLSGSGPLKAILINLHANYGIDLSSTDILLGLVAEAKETNTEILFAELQDPGASNVSAVWAIRSSRRGPAFPYR